MTDLSTFPYLGRYTMSHEELIEVLEKVADWKADFEKELQFNLSQCRKASKVTQNAQIKMGLQSQIEEIERVLGKVQREKEVHGK